jgi:PAS domain S-box-containing protein
MHNYIAEIVKKVSAISRFLTGSEALDANEERRRLITFFFLMFGIPVLYTFGILHLMSADYMEGILDIAAGVMLTISLVYLRYLQEGLVIYRINIALIGSLFLYFIFMGGDYGSRMLWMYTFPLVALFLLGKKEGLLWTLIVLFLSVIILFDPYSTFGTFHYQYEVKTRFLISFMLVIVLTYIYESVRQSFQEGMERERAELREERDKLSHITDNIHDIVWSLDLKTMQFLYVSPSVEHLTGFTVEESMKQQIEEIMTSESYEDSMKILEEEMALEDNVRADKSRMRETVWKGYHKDGRILVFGVTMSFLRDENGVPVGVIGVSRDITDRTRAEEDLRSYHEHLSLINKILRHDIINDLTVIRSALHLYGETKEKELLDDASKHVEKSVDLIRRMRELESFISRHRELKIYDIREVIDKVISSYSWITFEVDGNCQVMADEVLSSVIDNIVRNAVIHGRAERISINIEESGSMCNVRIADYGEGISDEIKEKIFDEGFVYGDTGHTGLGLHIVKKAMENYGGYVYIEDNEPKGTVFVLRLRALTEKGHL